MIDSHHAPQLAAVGAARRLEQPVMGTFYATFKPGNTVRYGQDFGFYRGVPPGVRFQVEVRGLGWRLTAPGYGQRGNYGNGALHVSLSQRRALDDGRGGG